MSSDLLTNDGPQYAVMDNGARVALYQGDDLIGVEESILNHSHLECITVHIGLPIPIAVHVKHKPRSIELLRIVESKTHDCIAHRAVVTQNGMERLDERTFLLLEPYEKHGPGPLIVPYMEQLDGFTTPGYMQIEPGDPATAYFSLHPNKIQECQKEPYDILLAATEALREKFLRFFLH